MLFKLVNVYVKKIFKNLHSKILIKFKDKFLNNKHDFFYFVKKVNLK